jgi:hypothetical protein
MIIEANGGLSCHVEAIYCSGIRTPFIEVDMKALLEASGLS